MATRQEEERMARAQAAGPFRNMDEPSARRLNHALVGALVRLETVDSDEVEGTFMGISLGNERSATGTAIWGDISVMLSPGLYLSANQRNVLKFEILQAVRYNCAFCGQWEGPDKLVSDPFAPNRLVHKGDCCSWGSR